MNKFLFDLNYKEKIIKGEIKVVTNAGEPVEIVKWDCVGSYPILAAIYDGNATDSCFFDKDGFSKSGTDQIYLIDSRSHLGDLENIMSKYFSAELIMLSKGFKDRLLEALEEAYNLDRNG
jgi:hypothetical protein